MKKRIFGMSVAIALTLGCLAGCGSWVPSVIT